MEADGIIFDLDGTLWDSTEEVAASWNLIISQHPGLRTPITREEQQNLMGLQMDEISRRVFPDLSEMKRKELMDACTAEENQFLRCHGAALYSGVSNTLAKLHTQYPLFIVSNCQSGYIEAFIESHSFLNTFDGILCFGDTGLGKAENIRIMMKQHQLSNPVYVGDTQGDQNAAMLAEVPFVYAAYGFGNVIHAPIQIHFFSDLLRLFPV